MTREEAIKIIDCYDIGFYDLSGEKIPAYKLAEAFDMAIEALSAEAISKAAETQQGEWIPLVMNGEYKCSVCGRASKSDNAAWVNIPSAYWNYCPNCGARMTKGGDDE